MCAFRFSQFPTLSLTPTLKPHIFLYVPRKTCTTSNHHWWTRRATTSRNMPWIIRNRTIAIKSLNTFKFSLILCTMSASNNYDHGSDNNESHTPSPLRYQIQDLVELFWRITVEQSQYFWVTKPILGLFLIGISILPILSRLDLYSLSGCHSTLLSWPQYPTPIKPTNKPHTR